MVKVAESLIKKYISTDRLLRPWSRDGKKGYIDTAGNWVIAPVYDDGDVFREGVAWVKTGDKWGLVNAKGEWVIAPKYDDAREFNDGLAAVKIDGRWGLIDRADNIVIETVYDNIWSVKRDWVVVRKDGMYGYVNPGNGNKVEPIYKTVREFSEGRAAVKLNNKWGFVDLNGNVVITPQYNRVADFINGESEVVTSDLMCGHIDLQGNAVEPFEEYEGEEYDSADYKWFYHDEPRDERCYYGFVNRDGETVIKIKYRDAYDFSNCMCMVSIDDKWGIIDHTGAYLVEPQYSEADIKELLKLISARCPKTGNKSDSPTFHISDGPAAVRVDGKWGYINTEGEMVIVPQFDEAEPFRNQRAVVKTDGLYGLIDTNGNFVLQPQYKSISQASTQIMGQEYGDYYALKLTSEYGSDAIGHRDGEVVILPEEFIIGHMGQDGMAVIQQSTEDELFGYANCETGNVIGPCYNYARPFNGGLGNVRLTEEQLLKRSLSTK